LVLASDDGKLFIYGTPPNLKIGRECEVMNSHVGAITGIQKSYDNKIVATCGVDSTIFIYRVSEVPNNKIGHFTKKLMDQVEEAERVISKKQKTLGGIDSHPTSTMEVNELEEE